MSWTKVLSKRNGFRWDVFPLGGMSLKIIETGVTSFYVSEFPDYFNAKRLFEIFGCTGNVAEVAISPRRNKVGKRFDFSRFRDVEEGRILAIRLDNILIEGRKIHVNLPRFDRAKNGGFGRQLQSVSKGHRGLVKPFACVADSFVNHQSGGKVGQKGTYASALLKGQSVEGNPERSIVMEFQSDKDLKARFEKAYVGRVCLPGSAYNIQNYLEMEGVYAIKVTPLGANCCLLEELEVGFIEDLTKEGETWWKSLFSTVEKWEVGSVDGCRDAWYRIYGVPLHAWCPEFFMALGGFWGRFVCLDESTSKGESLDVARILVNTPLLRRIPEVVVVSIDGEKHKLCVREDVNYFSKPSCDNKKVISSGTDTSESTDSDFERLMVESSSSGCSVAAEEMEVKEGFMAKLGGSDEKEMRVSTSGGDPAEANIDVACASIGEYSGGSVHRVAGSTTKSDPGESFCGGNYVTPSRLEAAGGELFPVLPCSSSKQSEDGQNVWKSKFRRAHYEGGFSVGAGVPLATSSLPDLGISSKAYLPGRGAAPGRKQINCHGKGVCSESESAGEEQAFCLSGGPVRVANSCNSGRAKSARSASSRERSRSVLNSALADSVAICCSASVPLSSQSGGILSAGPSKHFGAVDLSCADSIASSPKGLAAADGSSDAVIDLLFYKSVSSLPISNSNP